MDLNKPDIPSPLDWSGQAVTANIARLLDSSIANYQLFLHDEEGMKNAAVFIRSLLVEVGNH